MQVERWTSYVHSICKQGGPAPQDYEPLQTWFAEVQSARAEGLLSQESLQTLREAFGPAMSLDTLQGRSLLKPFGYAGDFKIIDEIYQAEHTPHPHLRRWDEFFHAQAATQAVRNRKDFFKRLIRKSLDARRAQRPLRVLNIASGPCRDIAEFLAQHQGANVHFTCVDVDQRAVDYGRNVCSAWSDRVLLIRANALRLRLDSTFDLVWSAGLFDYFDDRGFAFMLRKLFEFAAPSGKVVVGNFGDFNPSAAYQEFGDWSLVHRSAAVLMELAQESCGVPKSAIQVDSEPTGVNLFLQVTKVSDGAATVR